jgi:15-cis-phytoene synthase
MQLEINAKLCKAKMRHGSKSFFAASRLLPVRVRDDATALYAFCRVADDAIDLAPDASAREAALKHLHERLDHIYRAAPLAYAEDVMLAPVVLQHQVPRALLDALLEGFAWDAKGRRYESLAQLHDYCARVAGAVGVMMALIMGVRNSEALHLASELGAAMQLTNIARDIGEDARNQRVYIPLDWMKQLGIDPDQFMATPVSSSSINHLTERLLDEASDLYREAARGISLLPKDCRFAIRSAAAVYAEIGTQIKRNNLDSVSQRAVVGLPRKLGLIAENVFVREAKVAQKALSGRVNNEAREAGEFLVNAVKLADEKTNEVMTQDPANFTRSLLPYQRSFYGRSVWLLELGQAVAQRNRNNEALPS